MAEREEDRQPATPIRGRVRTARGTGVQVVVVAEGTLDNALDDALIALSKRGLVPPALIPRGSDEALPPEEYARRQRDRELGQPSGEFAVADLDVKYAPEEPSICLRRDELGLDATTDSGI